MASFVHVTDERLLRDILRGGIKPSKRDYGRYAPPGWPSRYVFCAPVLRDAESTFHWTREIAGPGRGQRGAAVQFRLPDAETVLVGVFSEEHRVMTAAEAVAAFLRAPAGPRGMQVLVPRAITPREIVRTRAVPRFIGWRYTPFNRFVPPVTERQSVAERKRMYREERRRLAAAAAERPDTWRRFLAALDPKRARRVALDYAWFLGEPDEEERAAWWRDVQEIIAEGARLRAEAGRD